MTDINFSTLRKYASSIPKYKLEDMGFADEDAFFAACNDRVSYLRDFFSEVYFLEDSEEVVSYMGRNGKRYDHKFNAIELPVNDEELVKIRDNVYDRGGDPNRLVLGVLDLFCDPDYGSLGDKSKSDKMKASYFVKC